MSTFSEQVKAHIQNYGSETRPETRTVQQNQNRSRVLSGGPTTAARDVAAKQRYEAQIQRAYSNNMPGQTPTLVLAPFSHNYNVGTGKTTIPFKYETPEERRGRHTTYWNKEFNLPEDTRIYSNSRIPGFKVEQLTESGVTRRSVTYPTQEAAVQAAQSGRVRWEYPPSSNQSLSKRLYRGMPTSANPFR